MQADSAFQEGSERRDPYRDLVEKARQLAMDKRAKGEIPDNTTEVLDRLFIETAPPGARSEKEGLEALVDVLARYSFDPAIQPDSTRKRGRWLAVATKRILRPFSSIFLRHMTNQLNAYHAAQIEILRNLVRRAEERNRK